MLLPDRAPTTGVAVGADDPAWPPTTDRSSQPRPPRRTRPRVAGYARHQCGPRCPAKPLVSPPCKGASGETTITFRSGGHGLLIASTLPSGLTQVTTQPP